MGRGRLAVYSDYVCPFCYLAWPGVRALMDAGWEVTLRAFELRPAPVPLMRALDEGKRRAWESHILPKAAELGLEARLPTLFPRTRKAHEAAHFARTLGLERQLHERLFHAYFAEGRDIGRIDVLVALGESIGMDRSALKVELDIDQFADAVAAEAGQVHELGIGAVPAYVIEGETPRVHVGLLEPAELRTWAEGERADR